GNDADVERHTRAVNDSAPDVAAELVSAEPEVAAGADQRRTGIDLGGAVRGDLLSEEGNEAHDHDHDQADGADGLLLEEEWSASNPPCETATAAVGAGGKRQDVGLLSHVAAPTPSPADRSTSRRDRRRG